MHYTTVTILAYACAAMASTLLPPRMVVRSADGLTDVSYAVSEMAWTGVVVEGSEPVTLNGTVESVLHQARKINPDFKMEEEDDEQETPSLETRNRADIICNIGGAHSAKATVNGIMNQRMYLHKLKGSCGVAARSCVRVACSWQDSVWLCNDNNKRIAPKCSYLAGYVSNILKKCENVQMGNCRECYFGHYSSEINGQQFDTDNYNVIAARDLTC